MSIGYAMESRGGIRALRDSAQGIPS